MKRSAGSSLRLIKLASLYGDERGQADCAKVRGFLASLQG
jgi:hypothetical protein